MGTQLTSNAEALRLFFNEDIYLVAGSTSIIEIETKLEAVVEESTPVSLKPKTEFKYLGKNQRNILILVNDSKNDVSTEQGRELLRKLVKAIDLTANDFAVVNYANYTTEKYEELRAFFNCKLMIVFGVGSTDLELPDQPLNKLVNYNESTHLFAKNLHDLDADIDSKKVLWASLQQLKTWSN